MNEWMSTPEAGTTQGKKMTPKTARGEPSTLAPGEPFAMYEQRVVPPPRATRFQAKNCVEDDSDDEDEGEGEELTETEDEGDHWRVQARSGPAAKSTSLRAANTLLTRARDAL